MTCEKYAEALIEVAAGGEKFDTGFADHLEQCTTCRMLFEREAKLFAAIDAGLRARVNEHPRAGFLAGIPLLIQQKARRTSGWTPLWTVAAAVVLLLIVTMHLWTGLRKRTVAGSPRDTAAPAQLRRQVAQARPQANPHFEGSRRAQIHSPKPPAIQPAAEREPEVLVPPDEADAFAAFVARVAGRDERAAAVVRPMADQAEDEKQQLLEIQPVDVADLQFEPLAWHKWK